MGSKQPRQTRRLNAVQCLRDQKKRILDLWEARAREELPAAAKKGHYLLLNSLPEFLDELVRALEKRGARLAAVKDVAESHATQRASIPDYSQQQVQAEYTILRQVIFEVMDECATLSAQERNIILDFIVTGRVAAADEYMRLAKWQTEWSEKRLSQALESAAMGTFEWDLESGDMVWSDALLKLHGIVPEEFSGKLEDFWPRVHPDDLPGLQDVVEKVIKAGERYEIEYRVIWSDESVHWILSKGRAFPHSGGKLGRVIGTSLEITERKRYEESLKAANEAIDNERRWFEMVLNSVPTPIFLLDAKTQTVFFENQATGTLPFAVPKNLYRDSPQNHYAVDIHGNKVAREDMPRHRILRGEIVTNLELAWHTSESVTPLLIDGNPLPAAHGHPAAGILTFRDVSPLKSAQEELRQSEAKFRALYESDIVGVAFGDISGALYEWNDYFLGLLGYTREDLRQGRLDWVELTPKGYLHLDERAIGEMREHGRCSPYDKPLVRKDGSWAWVTIVAAFLDEERFRHVSIIIDISEARKTRKTLEEREQELRLVTSSVPEIIWTSEPDGSTFHYNQNWYSYTGLTQKEGDGLKWEEIVHPEDLSRTLKAWEEAQATGNYTNEYRIRRHDGAYRWFLTRALPLRDAQGRIQRWFGATTDIEDLKRAHQDLERERELREQFVNTLTHDLRNPLSAAKASAQMIARHPERAERIPSLATRVTDGINRADKMIEDLLDASRIRAGRGLPIDVAECDLIEVVTAIREELATIHGDRFEVRAPASLKGYWSCRELRRMIENLVANAVKYGEPHTPVTISVAATEERVELSVHNSGDPIPQDEQAQLFQSYSRSKRAEAGVKRGWGLGLMLVRGVAEAHGGSVVVESAAGTGTRFTVRFFRDCRDLKKPDPV